MNEFKVPEGWKLVPEEPTPQMLEEIHLVSEFTGKALTARYRAMLAAAPAAPTADGTTSDKYRAELYDEVWQRARGMGYGNVTDALVELERLKAAAPVVQAEQGPVAFQCHSCKAQTPPPAPFKWYVECKECGEKTAATAAAEFANHATPPAHPDAALVDAADAALKAIQDTLEDAYHNAFPECCGQAHLECCGSPVLAWDERDQKIMDRLTPHEQALRAALAGKGGE